MAKNAFLDWDTTASNNTDIGGIGVLGTNAVSNFDDAFRTLMAQLRSGLDGKTVYAGKSGNYTAVANDNNAWHRYTANATVSLTAAATLGAGWHYSVQADGGTITIDPNGAETINGVTTLSVPNGAVAFIFCTGSAFVAAVLPNTYLNDSGALSGPGIVLFRESASPAASDQIGNIVFSGRNSAAASVAYGSINGRIIDPTSTSEDYAHEFYSMVAGTLTRIASLGPNLDLPTGQIKFPATQIPSSDVNTLDDYEEGSFTPSLTPNSGAITSAAASGTYTKVGNRVFFSINIGITTAGTGTGALFVGNFPFTIAGLATAAGANTASLVGAVGTGSAGSTQIAVATSAGGSIITSGTNWSLTGQYAT